MSSFTTKTDKKTGRTIYTYKGNLEEIIKKAKKELSEKENSEKRKYLLWQYQKAKKEHEAFEKRIRDLKSFIPLAEDHLKKEAENEADK